MTKQQQQLVEDNMNLVYFVLHDKFRRFVHDEDLVQTGMLALCNAGKQYDETRGSFSTYAYKSIYLAICSELNRRNKHRDADIISLDYVITNDEGGKTTLGDLIVGEPDIDYVDISDLCNKLSPLDKQILELREQGLTTRQIEKKIGFSRTYVSQRLRLMHKMYEDMYGEKND
jgi:RNA polymerase sigma factor (sigma-70 family)